MPKRIQRRRVKGYRMPENAVSVTRPGQWGNPFKVGNLITRPALDPRPGFELRLIRMQPSDAVEVFREYAEERMGEEPDWLTPLRGKDLACFCSPDAPCHADVLLELANREPVAPSL